MNKLGVKNSSLFLIIFAIVASVILAALIIIPTFEKIQCEDKEGKWRDSRRGGCWMDPQECRKAGGTPVGCLPTTALACWEGCQFG